MLKLPPTKDDADAVIDVPLMAFMYSKPVDGYPIYHTWLGVLKDILFRGFENWRDTFEVKISGVAGKTLDFGSVIAVRGLGRLSMLLWAILHSYTAMKGTMTPEKTADFGRWDGQKASSSRLPIFKKTKVMVPPRTSSSRYFGEPPPVSHLPPKISRR